MRAAPAKAIGIHQTAFTRTRLAASADISRRRVRGGIVLRGLARGSHLRGTADAELERRAGGKAKC